jgi:hypothetical protein
MAIRSTAWLGMIAFIDGCRASAPSPAPAAPADQAEITRLCAEDQADRAPHEGPVDGKAIVARDRERQARVKQLYTAGELRTGHDYHHAALILQHGQEPDDFLLAHELCVVALAKGDHEAAWLCAATEDRYLMNIGRPQRFATQYKSDAPGEPMRLYVVGDGVTDGLRAELHVPTLERAKEREALMDPAHHQSH